MGRTLACDENEGRLAVWPFYEGAGNAAREICGRGDALLWRDDGESGADGCR